MGDAARRCPKHPSQPPFTGFCSACLLDRLHATNLAPQPPPPPLVLEALEGNKEEEPPPCSTAATATGAGRTTLLHLFQLEDQGANHQRGGQEDTSNAAAPSTSGGDDDAQDPPPDLQRKRSLRQSCSDWIACCDTSAAANNSSCLPSRQSLDAAAVVAPADPHHPNNAAAAADASSTTSTGIAVVERRTGSLRWNHVRGFLAKPAGHLLNRSSESSRSRYARYPGNAAIARSSSQSQGMCLNGSHSVSSAGNGMDSSEISLPDDYSHVHHCRPRLKNRLHWLRGSRSRSVHYSSPTSLVDAGLTPFRSRSSSTRSTADKTQHARRLNLNLSAAGFFGTQRHQH